MSPYHTACYKATPDVPAVLHAILSKWHVHLALRASKVFCFSVSSPSHPFLTWLTGNLHSCIVYEAEHFVAALNSAVMQQNLVNVSDTDVAMFSSAVLELT